ncbi:MAG TPA: NAD(P)/FAD-dependent oxidoreductase, partial [Gemmatimonadales bacterium]|nr:NAD(P)/FAD-dependent oxidoreductase [Gemmatimonadales bacterium]
GTVRGRGHRAAEPASLTEALAAAARRAGVTIRTGATVARILVRDDRVSGVLLESGEEIPAGLVLSSADPARTLLGLVDPVWLDPEFLLAVRNVKHRGAEARVLFALDGLPAFPGLPSPGQALAGTLSLTPTTVALERAYDASKHGRVSESPHVEVSVPSIGSPGLAPANRHVLVARVQFAPWELDWNEGRAAALGDQVQRAIATAAPGFADRILGRAVLTPRDLEREFSLTEGATSHGELTLDQILFMRPVPGYGRHATPVAGLYLCGAGTHPGPGIPGGSGWLAAREALRG